jgi:hypothetical protein
MKKIALFSITLSLNLFSQNSGNISSSDLSRPNFLKKIVPNHITYFSEFSGPSVDGNRFNVNSEGEDVTRELETWNQISFQWELNSNIKIIANPRFIINHTTTSNSFSFDDPVFGFAGSFKFDKLSVNLELSSILPFARTLGTQNDRIVYNPGGFNSISYQIDNSYSAGLWFLYRVNFFEGKNPEDETLSTLVAPNFQYNISDKLGSVMLFYRFDNNVLNRNLLFEKDDSANLLYTYTFNKYISLQPILTVYREADFSLSKMQVNVWAYGTFF